MNADKHRYEKRGEFGCYPQMNAREKSRWKGALYKPLRYFTQKGFYLRVSAFICG